MFSMMWTLYCFISFLYLCNTQIFTSSSVKEDEGLHFYTRRHCLFEVSPFSRIFAYLWKWLLSVSSLQVIAKHGFTESNWKFWITPGLMSQKEKSYCKVTYYCCAESVSHWSRWFNCSRYLLQIWPVVIYEKLVSFVIFNNVLLWNCVRIRMLLKVLSKVGFFENLFKDLSFRQSFGV